MEVLGFFLDSNVARSPIAALQYELSVRQQPKQARMCGAGEKADRRPIDPPPIVRLRIRDKSKAQGENEPQNLIQSPFYFMFAALVPPDSDKEYFCVANTRSRYLTGTVVSSLYHLRDPTDNTYSAFFVFPDIGVRVEGAFRFRLTMYEIAGNEVHQCASIFTNPFHVYSAKRFPGMEGSTELSKSFAEQGIRIRIRRPIRLRRRMPDDPEQEAEDDDAPAEPAAKRPRVDTAAKYDMPPQYTHPLYGSTGGFVPQQPTGGYGYSTASPQMPASPHLQGGPRGGYAPMGSPVAMSPAYVVGGIPNHPYIAQPGQGTTPIQSPVQRQGSQFQYPAYPYSPAGQQTPTASQQSSPYSTYSTPGRPSYPYNSPQPGVAYSQQIGFLPPPPKGSPYTSQPQMGYPTAPTHHNQYAPTNVHSQANAYYGLPPQASYPPGQTPYPGSADGAQSRSGTGPQAPLLPPLKMGEANSNGANEVHGEESDVDGHRGNGSLASLLN